MEEWRNLNIFKEQELEKMYYLWGNLVIFFESDILNPAYCLTHSVLSLSLCVCVCVCVCVFEPRKRKKEHDRNVPNNGLSGKQLYNGKQLSQSWQFRSLFRTQYSKRKLLDTLLFPKEGESLTLQTYFIAAVIRRV